MEDRAMASGDDVEPGRAAARTARGLIEEALFAMPDIPVALDREGLRGRLLRGIELLYTVLDTPVVALAHLDGLNEAAAIAAECGAIMARAGEGHAVPALGAAVARLGAAEAELRRAAEGVARIQLTRRSEIVFGALDAPLPAARPLRASCGAPELHAIARRPLAPHVVVEPRRPLPDAAPPPPKPPPKPRTLEELAVFAEAAASGELERRFAAGDGGAAPPEEVLPPFAFEPAIEEVEVLRRLARDCLEDIAAGRSLRKPNAIESWLDQAPFEQRLLDNLDAFAALGGPALSSVSIYHADAKIPDPERAFAVALTLGCIEGSDTVGAAVMTLKQSAPEEHPGWLEGFWLAPNPAIDRAMTDLCASSRPALAALALDVLLARGQISDEIVAPLLGRTEPEIALRVARVLAVTLSRRDAVDHLELICKEATDDDLFLAGVESLLRRGHAQAVQLLRTAVDVPASLSRAQKGMSLLCLIGRASDLDRLLAGASAAPAAHVLRSLGRFGHVGSLGALVGFLEHEDPEIVAAAAEALDRITGAGLRETVEEPWEVELPPEAAEAGGIPVPTRKVERIVTDPEQWSAWLRNRAPRLDARLKTRGGTAFTPLQIVDELESRITPPAAREEAALELALVTGLHSQFSPQDWVARQRQHLSDLRAHVAAYKVTPGTWSHGLMREPERAAPLLPSQAHRSASAPVTSLAEPDAPLGHLGQSVPEAWEPREGAGASRPARPPLPESGQPIATALAALATNHGAPQLPPALPDMAWTERAGTYIFGEQQDNEARTIDAFATDMSLPFRTASPGVEERRDPCVLEHTPTSTVSVDLGKTMAGPLLPPPPVLPFHNTGSPRSVTARDVERSPPANASRTVSAPLVPPAPALPFRPVQSPPEQDFGNTAPVSGQPLGVSTSLTMPQSVPVIPTTPVTPFRPRDDSSEPTSLLSSPIVEPVHSSGAPSSSAPPLPSGQPNPPGAETVLSLGQYASLCAELAVFPWATEAIFQRYGLQSQQARMAVDAAWKDRLGRDAVAYGTWQEMYRRYREYWTKRGTPVK